VHGDGDEYHIVWGAQAVPNHVWQEPAATKCQQQDSRISSLTPVGNGVEDSQITSSVSPEIASSRTPAFGAQLSSQTPTFSPKAISPQLQYWAIFRHPPQPKAIHQSARSLAWTATTAVRT